MMQSIRATDIYKYNGDGWLQGKLVRVVAPVEGSWTKVDLEDGRYTIINSKNLVEASPAEKAAWCK